MVLRQDVAYAARVLRRSPLFTLTAVLSLAIGIAANAAIFSLADALLLRSRPGIANEHRLVDIGRSQDGDGFDNMSYLTYVDLRDRNTVFSGVAGYRFSPEPVGLGAAGGAQRVFGQAVSANYFSVLGVPMARGRGFLPQEDRVGAPQPVVVIGHTLWQARLLGEDVVGRTVRLNGQPFTIVGIAAAGFTGNSMMSADVWVPFAIYPALMGKPDDMLTSRRGVSMMAVGRLKPGSTIDQARSEAAAIGRNLEREYPKENKGRGVVVAPSHRLGGTLWTYAAAFVGLLFTLVGLVLLIACTNVAGMLLARGVVRSREVAVRIAVGARPARIVRQIVTESMLLALGGTALGVLFATWMIGALRGLLPSAIPVQLALDLRLDWRVVAFSLALAVTTGILFGLVPALQAARTDVAISLKDAAAGSAPRRLRLRQAFVVAQVAMSVLLVVCALLLARSLANAANIDLGFTTEHVKVVGLDFNLGGHDEMAGARLAETILARVEQIPGVRAAAFARMIPLASGGLGLGRLWKPGTDPSSPDADWNVVTPGYFDAVQTPLVRGRNFTVLDRAGAPDAAIVNETFARRAWPGEEAVGKTLLWEREPGAPPRVVQVVGIAKDGKYRSLGEDPRAFVYVPLAQYYMSETNLIARGEAGRPLLADLIAMVRQLDPNLPVTLAASLADATAVGLLPHRLAASIAGGFGVVGVLLAAIGIYGVTAFNVTQRRREIGVRVALGATRDRVLRLVVGQSMRMASLGVVVGLAAAAGATQLLAALLYGIQPLDPASFSLAAVAFAALAFVASWLPARRAASVNPVDALRSE